MEVMRQSYLFIILFLFMFSSCKKENMCDCFKSTGSTFTEKRVLGDFDQLEVNDNIDVVLVEDTLNYAEVEAGKNLIDLIDTKIDNNQLNIANRNTCNWVRSYKKEITVTVHFKQLKQIVHYGSKEIVSSNIIHADVLN